MDVDFGDIELLSIIFCGLPLPLSPFRAPLPPTVVCLGLESTGVQGPSPFSLSFPCGDLCPGWNRDLFAEGKCGSSQRGVQWFGYLLSAACPTLLTCLSSQVASWGFLT